jgi:hypothetical protein
MQCEAIIAVSSKAGKVDGCRLRMDWFEKSSVSRFRTREEALSHLGVNSCVAVQNSYGRHGKLAMATLTCLLNTPLGLVEDAE